MIWKDTCNPMFTAALFTITRIGKQPKCPSTEERIKKMWYKDTSKCAKSLQSCPTLCNPMDYSPPGSSVHVILQARILEWVVMPFCRESSRPRNWTRVLCIVGWFFSVWATREAQLSWNQASKHLFRQQIYLESDMLERITSLGIHAIQADDSGQGPLQKWN